MLVVEVPEDKAGEIFLLLQSAGGQEVAITEMQIPRQPEGQLSGPEDISPEVRADLSEAAQSKFVEAYNEALKESNDEKTALVKAWEHIKRLFQRDDQGVYGS